MNKLFYGDNLDVLRRFSREGFYEILTNANGVQTQRSIALINGLEKVLGKGALFAYLVLK